MTSFRRAKRLGMGHYVYRGFKVNNIYPLGWEAVDEFGCGFAHAVTLSGVKALIDWELDVRNKDNNNDQSLEAKEVSE